MLMINHSNALVLKLLGQKKANFYRHQKASPSKRRLENERLSKVIKQEYDAVKGRYGAPKICQILKAAKEKVSLKRVQKLMKAQGLRCVTVKKWKPCTIEACPDRPEYVNLLEQNFSADKLNQKWSTDITYIHTAKDGWCYLSSIMDLCSHKIIAWKFSKRMTKELVKETLDLVRDRAQEGLILQTDRGSQYLSNAYEARLKELGIKHSYSKKGYPYDNSMIESFHASLKKEEVYLTSYWDFITAQRRLFDYIEGFYNLNRIHSAIDYKTPQEFENFMAS